MDTIAQLSTQNATDELAAFCKAAGEPLRLNILRALSNDSFGVLELAHIFATGQSGISHHLKVLTQAGLVTSRREGNAIFYRRSLPHSQGRDELLHQALLSSLDKLPVSEEIAQRIEHVHAQRAQASQEFFERMAGDFQSRQDLIAGLPQFRDSLLALLDSLTFAPEATAIEVGPGDGVFLVELASRFQQVVAIDNSPQMLELARHTCAKQGLANVELKLADALYDALPVADCVVVNMVLHHFAAPAEALSQLARLIKPGGSLLITELCRHDQDWAKQACGDLWLGFDQDELALWASAAGLKPSESLYLGLKNGFQIQLRHFAKPDHEAISRTGS
ncbi:metalloregulator ArsR/SmtB family transcription factor [Denitrificimonas sp. JX-1]|uniref:Metalloregulator ArsR/SmtB family transcription factor n=1 Tax=Denitrificimonas halotolerans TaxID=3098930 RepID=A0ABU5GN91_9GAMM|nr:metalloregulator ArsR/SmtB family transcription factor [Denitrificimonas sp. JX-1]MDY7218391.1 metalloregulator ArsR/SmtB family transcription factor [Denitrificimonas sp. JX-1]